MKFTTKKIIALLLCACFGLSLLSACSGKAAEPSQNANKKEIKLGALASSEPLITWIKEGLEPKGYKIECVVFNENNLPATALKNSEIDGLIANHKPWIETFSKENNCELKMVEPYYYYSEFGFYSTKHKKLEEIPDGATITIMSDPTNLSRCMVILKDLGFFTLKDKTGDFYTVMDIDVNTKNVKLVEADILATARSLPDVDAAICPAYFAKNAGGVDPSGALYVDPTSSDYPLGLIVQSKDTEAKWAKDAIEYLRSKEGRKKFIEYFGNTYVLFE